MFTGFKDILIIPGGTTVDTYYGIKGFLHGIFVYGYLRMCNSSFTNLFSIPNFLHNTSFY